MILFIRYGLVYNSLDAGCKAVEVRVDLQPEEIRIQVKLLLDQDTGEPSPRSGYR